MAADPGIDADPRPLHQRDPTGRFSQRADDYVRYRPTYPAMAIDAMLADLGDPSTLVAADVGAGTGISSRLLAERGVRVLAVEPNAAMRAMAEPHPRVEWIDASAEATTLADASVDLVLCAQAFHWFEQEAALRDFHRILRRSSRARLALLWNDDDPEDPVMRGYRAAVTTAATRDWTASNPFGAADLESRGPFVNARQLLFTHEQRLDRAGLVGRARSASYVPRDGDRFQRLVQELHELHAAHADRHGLVTLRYRTQLYLAEPAPRAAPSEPLRRPTERFTDRAADYARYRTGYPSAVLVPVLAGLGDPRSLSAADVGAGTGLFSRELAEAGVTVLAIEPNAAMRAEALPHPRVSWIAASAERTGLPTGELDLIVCATSFHWFRRIEALLEFHRILRTRGRLAILWKDWSRADGFSAGIDDAVIRASGLAGSDDNRIRVSDLVQSGLFRNGRETTLVHETFVTIDQLLGLIESLSITPRSGPDREPLLAAVRSLHAAAADAAGRATLRYQVQVLTADAVPFGGAPAGRAS